MCARTPRLLGVSALENLNKSPLDGPFASSALTLFHVLVRRGLVCVCCSQTCLAPQKAQSTFPSTNICFEAQVKHRKVGLEGSRR
mmetsp:Transcript_19265/g.43657  ORF Transcript_19265/g.43657 Transcript_19265/m.43657 type:complete len:85 (+) Transcript_19265:352-606(+)